MWTHLAILVACFAYVHGANPCKLMKEQDNYYVCVCNKDYCDEIEPLGNIEGNHAAVYYSTESGKRMEKYTIEATSNRPDNNIRIHVDTRYVYQEILGFGGAFTDATGINLKAIGNDLANKIIDTYYSADKGIGYTFGRVPIASTDFSTHAYSYDDVSNDFSLSQFNLASEDHDYKIPYIKRAKQANGNIKLMATPWSAPAWMKNTGRMQGGGSLKGDFLGTYWKTYANYIVKFFEAYKNEGIDFWGLSVQNEPNTGQWEDFPWQTQYYTAEMERDFIKSLLGPALRNSNAGRNVGIIINDDNRKNLPSWPNTIIGDGDAAKYVIGTGVHWYEDGNTPVSVLTDVHNSHSDKFILNTEASCGFKANGMGEWYAAQLITDDLMDDLTNFAAGWIDWNLVLNKDGGPTFVNNNVKSNIVVNAAAGEFYKTPLFHHMAHFSKFVRPGSHRVAFDRDSSEDPWNDIKAIPFLNPQGQKVVVVINKSWNTAHDVVIEEYNKFYKISMEKYSMATIIFN